MKKFTKFLVTILIFVVLFYHQGWKPGFNLSIFCLLLWWILSSFPMKRPKGFWWFSGTVMLTSLSFAWYGDFLSFFALVLSTLTFGLYLQYSKIKIVLYPVLWIISYITFIFRIFYFDSWMPKQVIQGKSGKKILAYFVIPLGIGTTFTLVYTSGSRLFASFFQDFFGNFDILELLLLIAIGLFFMFNLWFPLIPKEVIKWNMRLQNDFAPQKAASLKEKAKSVDLTTQKWSGIISLLLLNLILLIFIISYNYEQFFQTLGKTSLSQETHQQVGSVIFSILLVIGIILFYFKSTFNFDPEAVLLKRLSILWIILNSLLIASTFLINSHYIYEYGLTFKRISVYIFLLLCLVGLYFTYFKIKRRKTNSYLFRKMLLVFFITFIVCSTLNFSWIVTKYNITFQQHPDTIYLKSLHYNKQLLRKEYGKNPAWQPYFKRERQEQKASLKQPFLSHSLYDYLSIQ